MPAKLCSCFLFCLCLSHPAMADLRVQFVESAPKDRFVFENKSTCTLSSLRIQIDLASSAGKLIFDTTSQGAGVEVYQPFEVRTGKIVLNNPVRDGDNQLQIQIARLASGEQASFTIDVDDTLTRSVLGNIRVAGSEIEYGTVNLYAGTPKPVSAQFSEAGIATLAVAECTG